MRHHEGTPGRVGSQHAVISHQIGTRRRNQCTELLDENKRFKEKGPGPVLIRMPEPVTNPAIGKKREALGCDGETGHVPAQPFQVLPPAAMDAHVGVERETIGGRATIPGEFDETDSPDLPGQLVHLMVFHIAEGMKYRRVMIGRSGVHAVEHQGMEMGVQVDGSSEPLEEHDGPVCPSRMPVCRAFRLRKVWIVRMKIRLTSPHSTRSKAMR